MTLSLLYAWIRLYQERGEAAFVPSRATQYPPEIERPQHGLEQVTYLERLCGQQALQLERLALGGGSIKKSLALVWRQAPIQQRHTLIERMRELMPSVSVRKLCALFNINRQWYYQHRRCSVQNGRDRPLCLALQELRNDFAGFGYRRMTKARKTAGLEDQSQTGGARDSASGSDLSAQAAVCPYH